MAYQNVGTPRFYVSWGDWLKTSGITVNYATLLNPYTTSSQSIGSEEDDSESYRVTAGGGTYPLNINKGANFWFCLNHDFNSRDVIIKRTNAGIPDGETAGQQDFHNYMGAETASVNYVGTNSEIEHNGWSMRVGDDIGWGTHYTTGVENIEVGWRTVPHQTAVEAGTTHSFGCFVYGRKYDMPHSPDLKLTLSYEYDGVKTIQTKGGTTISNAMYTKPADWGNMGAWQLGDVGGVPISNLRSGRRIWDLSFSYLSDSDIFPSVAAVTNYEAGDSFVEDNPQDNTLLEGTDFFSAVWNKTFAGHLPFIFQPDGGGGVAGEGNFNPDQFAIARFDMKSLQYEQVSKNIYNVSLKIKESW